MKQFLTTAILFTFFTVTFTACQKNNSPDVLKEKEYSPEQFFEKISKMNLKAKGENVILINFQWNKKNKTFTYLSSTEKKPDASLGWALGLRGMFKSSANKYTVHCEKDNKLNSWEDECSGAVSCGKLISKCLDDEGCATICKKQMIYAPQINTFILR